MIVNQLPTHCMFCGAYLMGGATKHLPGCRILQIIKRANAAVKEETAKKQEEKK
jgi:hypothetical protein